MRRDTTSLFIIILLILVGFAFRLYSIDTVPLRGDEAFSALYWSGLPLSESLSEIATIEPHPPLTYAVFRVWGILFGIDHPFALRSLSSLLNLIGIPAIFAIGRHFGSRKWGVLAALIWAINPFQIWHAQDFRNYGMWSGLSLVALWLALLVFRYRSRMHWIRYILFATVTAFIFYMEALVMVVLSLYVLVRFRGDKPFIGKWLVVQAGILGALVLAFPVLQGDLIASGDYVGTTGGVADVGQLFTHFLPTLVFGDTLPADLMSGWWLILIVVLVVAATILWKVYPGHTFLLLLLGIVPLIILSVVSSRMNIFRPRYVMISAPAYVLLFSGAIVFLSEKFQNNLLRRIISVGLLSIWLLISFYSLNNYYHHPSSAKAPRWDALTNYLHENVLDDDLVIRTSVDPAFGYYYQADAEDIGLPANHLQSAQDIRQTLEDRRSQYRSFWIVARTLFDWQNIDVVETWAFENMQLVRETFTEGLPVRQFMEWEIGENEIEPTVLTTFDDLVSLTGSKIYQTPEPTGELTIWLYWEPIEQADTSYKIFVHLLGETNPTTGSALLSQDDQLPQDGRIEAMSWETGEIYRDVYSLPVGNITGEFTIVVGWYDPETGDRLLTSSGDDHYVLGSIILK